MPRWWAPTHPTVMQRAFPSRPDLWRKTGLALAKHLNLSKMHVYAVLRGEQGLSGRKLVEMAAALGMTPAELQASLDRIAGRDQTKAEVERWRGQVKGVDKRVRVVKGLKGVWEE